MSTHQLRQQRDPLLAALREIRDAATNAGTLSPEQQSKVDELRGKLADLDKRIGLQELIDGEERRAAGVTLTGGSDANFDRLASEVTMLDTLRAQLPGATDHASGRAREVSAELERRSGRRAQGLFYRMGAAQQPEQRNFTTSSGGGSALIQTDVSPNLIDRLRQRIIVRALGAVVLTGLQGNLNIPRLTGSTTGYWVAEDGAITESDPATDDVSLTPHHAGALTELSRNMLMQPSIDVTRMIEGDMARILANAIDVAALVGGGSNQPSGLLASGSGIGSVALGTNGGAPTWNSIMGLVAAVDTANALAGSLAFAGNAKTTSVMRRTLRTSADTASTFIQEAPDRLAGFPYVSSQNVPSTLTKGTTSGTCSALLFGDFTQLVIGFWSELDLCANPYESTAYSKGNVQVRAMTTCDVGLRHPLAFAAIQDMVTT